MSEKQKSEHQRIQDIELYLDEIKPLLSHIEGLRTVAPLSTSMFTPAAAGLPFIWWQPIWMAPPPPPPPPPPDDDGFDLGDLGDLIKGTVPKSGGTGKECETKTILANWTKMPRTRTVTIAHVGKVTVKLISAAGGDLPLVGVGSVTIDMELQPKELLQIHIDEDGAKFAAWW